MTYFEHRRQVADSDAGTLREFLSKQLQLWRLDIMLAEGGIRVERGNQQVANLKLDYRLRAGDVVVIDDANGWTWYKLIKEATTKYRDYVFAPNRGKDPFLNAQHDVLLLHPGAMDIDSSVANLKQLIGGLARNCPAPIRHFIFVGHANPYGDIGIPMRDSRGDPDPNASSITWESLKEAIAEKYLMIAGPDKEPTVMPRPEDAKGKRIPCAIVIRGCSNGRNTIMLAKIREAFGYMIDIVVMPKFFNAAAKIGEDKKDPTKFAAWVEYFTHDFHVFSKTKLDRAALIKAFQGKKFVDWLGAAMPDSSWEDLIPKQYSTPGSVIDTKAFTMTVPGRQQKGTFKGKFQAEKAATNTVVVSQIDKPDEAAMRDALSKSWKRLPASSDPEWPLWTRYGMETFEDLIALFNFEIDPDPKASKPGAWSVNGYCFEYTVRTPLIEKDTLYANYFPVGEADANNVMTLSIDYNDKRVFGQANFIPSHFADKI